MSYGGVSATARAPQHLPHPQPSPGRRQFPRARATSRARPLRRSLVSRTSWPPIHPCRRTRCEPRAGFRRRCIGPCQVLVRPTRRPYAHGTTHDSAPDLDACIGVKTCIQFHRSWAHCEVMRRVRTGFLFLIGPLQTKALVCEIGPVGNHQGNVPKSLFKHRWFCLSATYKTMQYDFQMLAVSDADDPCIVHADAPYSQDSADCFDKEAMKKKYPNISEEAMIFLIRLECATAKKSSPTRKKESLADSRRPSSFVPSPDASLALPPPKRFTRVLKRSLSA
jgi:hypothetical protein